MRWLGVALTVLAVAFVYGPGLDAADDQSALVDNPQLRQLSTAFDPPADSSLTVGHSFMRRSRSATRSLGFHRSHIAHQTCCCIC